MSNLIKYPFVNMNGKETKIIQYEDKKEFVPFDQKKRVLVKTLEEVKREEELSKQMKDSEKQKAESEAESEAEFVPGVSVKNFDEIFEKKKQEATSMADEIVAKAQQEAESIVSDAKNQMEEIRMAAREEGIAQGREEGLSQAAQELEQMRAELQEEKIRQEREYTRLVQGVEGKYVEILCGLITKLTGVIVEDKQDVILHLIRSAIRDIDSSKKYVIRVCSQDLFTVEANKEKIRNEMGMEAVLEVQEEKSLGTGEGIIETDTQMVDCGFRTQLDNLISTLRMLA